MRNLFLLIFATTLYSGAFGQAQTFSQGDFVLNATIGLGSTLYNGAYYNTTIPALAVSGEYGVKDDFITEKLTLGVGGYFGFAGSKYETSFFGSRYGYKYNYTIIGGRAAAHYPFVDKLDTYAGAMLGFGVVSYKEIGDAPDTFNNPQNSRVIFSIYTGARYYFTPNFAALAEIGYGIAWLNIGVSFKF